MKERLIENWLTKTDERGFQTTFYQLLIAQGYKIIHLSKHTAFEQGKDIIAIKPDGTPCSYQLKVGDISLNDWRLTIRPEVDDLLDTQIKHPSITPHHEHESWLVTTGDLSDTVRIDIDDRNNKRVHNGKLPLFVKVKGELISDFLSIHEHYFPIEPKDLKRFLELYMADGKSEIPKAEYSNFLFSTLPFFKSSLSSRELTRAISSTILLANYIVESYRRSENHWGVVEAWVLTLMYIFALLEFAGKNPKDEEQSIKLLELLIEQALIDLKNEVVSRRDYLFEDGIFDPPMYKFRTTLIAGWLSGYVLFNLFRENHYNNDESILDLIEQSLLPLNLWGEAALPSFLNLMWNYAAYSKNQQRDSVLENLLRLYIEKFTGKKNVGLLNPYYGVDIGVRIETNTLKEPIFESFSIGSYSIESLICLAARYGLRDCLSSLWKPISYLQCFQFDPREKWENYLWRSEHGELKSRLPSQSQSWIKLCSESNIDEDNELPQGLLLYPELLPLFIMVYPHRIKPMLVKRIDSLIKSILSKEK